MSKVKKAAPRKKGANGYKLPEPIPLGEVITDVHKKQWKIGPSIGVGGFGEIYSAAEVGDSCKISSYPYVIKIEPHSNGPLFVEMHFYMRVGKQEDIAEWMKQRKLTHLGMSRFIGSGSHECHNEKYRFVVMERYAQDLWSLFLENKRVFPVETVARLAYQIINTLEYIHHKGYVHADIKGANLLLGMKSSAHVFLVDFGLAAKHNEESKPNPKRAHDGTAEYTSRDAHTGAMTRRGDLEVLAYNLLQWMCTKLPWEDNLTNPVKLHQAKTAFMSNVRENLAKCFGKSKPPDFLVKFFDYICGMSIDQVPDYDYCRNLFKEGLKKCGASLEGKLMFSGAAGKVVKSPAKAVKSPAKAVKLPAKKAPKQKAPARQPTDSDDDEETTPSPIKRRRKATTVTAVSDSDDDEQSLPVARSWRDYPAAFVSDNNPEEKKPATTPARKERKKKPVPDAPSWKDQPAAMASNIQRPGEYVSTNGNDKVGKRQRK